MASANIFICLSSLVLLAMSAVPLAEAGNSVPVMLWYGESSNNLVNPLHKTSKHEFEETLLKRLGKTHPPLILFVKDSFCIEDINKHKNLQQLNNAGSLTYLPSVESALSVFENLSLYNISYSTERDLDSVSEGQLAILQVSDLNAIPEIYNLLRELSPNLKVALTGKTCSHTNDRIKRQAVDNEKVEKAPVPVIVSEPGILFYSGQAPMIKINKEDAVQLSGPISSSVIQVNGTTNLTMTFKGGNNGVPDSITLTAHVIESTMSAGYYSLRGFQYTGDSKTVFLKSNEDIYFPYNTSYHCGTDNLFTYLSKANNTVDKITVTIKNMQVQMNATKFGDDVWDCSGYFSAPIWTGIFVTFILAMIMIWGISMLMDIHTMDRFDDPKGKTITITAQE
ncbi:hypothetical protein TKK_0016308 [Trichogramma kaykai]|uniref:V-type proton ATPase subunit S1 n=1 Tax=Trichogramma kaykai TaxID=54128 RepID=A0ABD2W8A8_9HYME